MGVIYNQTTYRDVPCQKVDKDTMYQSKELVKTVIQISYLNSMASYLEAKILNYLFWLSMRTHSNILVHKIFEKSRNKNCKVFFSIKALSGTKSKSVSELPKDNRALFKKRDQNQFSDNYVIIILSIEKQPFHVPMMHSHQIYLKKILQLDDMYLRVEPLNLKEKHIVFLDQNGIYPKAFHQRKKTIHSIPTKLHQSMFIFPEPIRTIPEDSITLEDQDHSQKVNLNTFRLLDKQLRETIKMLYQHKYNWIHENCYVRFLFNNNYYEISLSDYGGVLILIFQVTFHKTLCNNNKLESIIQVMLYAYLCNCCYVHSYADNAVCIVMHCNYYDMSKLSMDK